MRAMSGLTAVVLVCSLPMGQHQTLVLPTATVDAAVASALGQGSHSGWPGSAGDSSDPLDAFEDDSPRTAAEPEAGAGQ